MSNATQTEKTPQAAQCPLAERSPPSNNEKQVTDNSQPTISPTGGEGNPYTEWKYIDPSLVTISSEEDEKVTDI